MLFRSFEARSPKDAGMLAETTGTVSFGKDTKGKQRLVITDLDGVASEFLIPKDKHVTAHDGQVVTKGETIVDGPADPQDILRLQGREALARYPQSVFAAGSTDRLPSRLWC